MNTQTLPPRRKPEGKLACRVQRGPHWLTVAIRGEASFDQAEVIAAQLLRIPLDTFSLVVFDLAELTFISSLAMGALVAYRRGLYWHDRRPWPWPGRGVRSGSVRAAHAASLRAEEAEEIKAAGEIMPPSNPLTSPIAPGRPVCAPGWLSSHDTAGH
jgi:hypothetical protein